VAASCYDERRGTGAGQLGYVVVALAVGEGPGAGAWWAGSGEEGPRYLSGDMTADGEQFAHDTGEEVRSVCVSSVDDVGCANFTAGSVDGVGS
jgi:hypothetical protein